LVLKTFERFLFVRLNKDLIDQSITVSVVGALLFRARRVGICCLTVLVTQNWVSMLLNVSWKRTFWGTIEDKTY